jgi:hypothetical protein
MRQRRTSLNLCLSGLAGASISAPAAASAISWSPVCDMFGFVNYVWESSIFSATLLVWVLHASSPKFWYNMAKF